MKLRVALLPAALLTALAFSANDAAAAPLTSAPSTAVFGPRIHVGGGVGINIPIHIGRRRHVAHPVRVVHQPAGHWETVRERVWHPRELVGYDSHGRATYSPGHWDYIERRVWVPAPVVVHRPVRVIRPRRPIGNIHIGLGGRWRLR